MNRREKKILKRLYRRPATTQAIVRDIGVGIMSSQVVLSDLLERGWVVRCGQTWVATREAEDAYLEAAQPWWAPFSCPACIRFRGPLHWLLRRSGLCPGREGL